jgi:predicted HTH transcriptional regulator
MPENQNVEYKSSWRDEYLKWICGFANAQGGKLYIGIDDNGNVCGVQNAKKNSWKISRIKSKHVCKELGAELPRYEILGNGVRVFFKALKSALIDEKTANVQENVGINEQNVIKMISENANISAKEVAEKLAITIRQAERIFAQLKQKKLIVRKGARKNGYWQIVKDA